jgi:WD40-like Beta Propeller Repeat
MTCFLNVYRTLLLGFIFLGQVSVAQATTELPTGENQEGSSTAQINASALTPLAGDYQCMTSSFTYSPAQGPAGPLLIVQFNPSLLGSITLDGKGNYRVGDNTGTYVYSPASGFTFTRGSLAGWPAIFDTYDSGLELRLSSSQDEPPSPEGGFVGEHVCQLEVSGFTAATTNGEPSATGGVQSAASINGGFTGTLTFRDAWTNDMIDDLELATGKVSGLFAGSDPHRNATGETVFINGQGGVVIVDPQGLVVTTFPSDDNGSDPQRPVFSYDGSLVAYTLGSPYYETHVIVRQRDGTKVADFINMVDPSWTPDGRLVMASNTQYQDAPVGIFSSDAALTTTTRLDPNLDETHDPAISPDGQTVAFVYHGQIWLMGIDGSNPHQLAPFDGGAESPAWSPDGTALVVLGTEYSEPYLVSLDGRVTKVQTDEGSGIQVSGQISWQQ